MCKKFEKLMKKRVNFFVDFCNNFTMKISLQSMKSVVLY